MSMNWTTNFRLTSDVTQAMIGETASNYNEIHGTITMPSELIPQCQWPVTQVGFKYTGKIVCFSGYIYTGT